MHGPLSLEISAGRRTYIVVILTAVYFFNFVDRQIIGILLESIRQDMSIPDWQLGLIIGLGFALLYTTIGLPLAWLAEKSDRIWIVTASLAIWSLMTILCGFAQTAIQLFLCRVGVGLGEAGGSPPSHSILSDLYPRARRAGALSIWSLGSPLGSAVGLVFGAWVAKEYGWRMAFVAVGLPGLLLAVLMRGTVGDPARIDHHIPQPPLWQQIVTLLRKPSFLLASLGAGIASLFGYVTVFWGPTYFIRVFNLDTVTVAFYGALLIVTSTSAGTVIGGRLVDLLSPRWPAAALAVPALAMIAAAPLYWLAFSVHEPAVAAGTLILPTALTAFWSGPVFAHAQNLTPKGSRAVSTALLFLILNVVGLSLGPTLTGILSSHFFPTHGLAGGLHAALNYIVAAAFPSALLLFLAARWVASDLQNLHLNQDGIVHAY